MAALLALGFAVPSSHAVKPKKVASEVDIDGWDFPPPDFDFTFVGNVYAKKAKCVRNRTVTVFRVADDEPVGTTTTDATGDWRLVPSSLNVTTYEARVTKKRTGKPGKKLVCKADASPTFIVPP
jgi:hypothetical protein